MKIGFAFRIEESRDRAVERTTEFLVQHCGFRESGSTDRCLRFLRGSRLQRLLTLRIERWPTELTVILYGEGHQETGLVLRYHVTTGFHLVGALEKAILESEAAVLQEFLTSGRVRTVESVVGSSRRPVMVAVMLNAVLASVVVAAIGLLAGYDPVAVGLVAIVVGLLDGLTITAFADIMVDGARALPRVRGSEAAPTAAASSSGLDS